MSRPRFANLRSWCQWVADYGKTSTCCVFVRDVAEIQARPEKFDCSRCERQEQWSQLWPENVVAWSCYQALARRTVRDIQAGPWVISTFTAGWSWQRTADLLARVDLILEIVAPPKGTPERHGRPTST